jgi:hypothetical protein
VDPQAAEGIAKQGIFDATMADTLKAIEGGVKAAADRTSVAAWAPNDRLVTKADDGGDALINQGANFLVEQFREVAREATATMLTELRRETARAERASAIAVRLVWAFWSLGVQSSSPHSLDWLRAWIVATALRLGIATEARSSSMEPVSIPYWHNCADVRPLNHDEDRDRTDSFVRLCRFFGRGRRSHFESGLLLGD